MLCDAGQHARGRRWRRACAALLRHADGRGRRRLRLAGLRREHRQRAVLHLRHHRAAEGRAVQPPLHLAARLCRSRCPMCWPCARPAGCCRWCRCSTSTPGACPYAAALTGASLVLPGRHLDGASLAALLNAERVTFTAGVPTVWLGLLQHLRASGERLTRVKRIMTGGSAAPPLLIEAFRDEYGVRGRARLGHDRTQPGRHLQRAEAGAGRPDRGRGATQHMLKQGRVLPGIDMKIVDGDGNGTALGRRRVRRPEGARPLGRQRLLRRRARQRAATRTAGSPPATSPPSTRTASWRSPTAPRT